MEKKNQSKRSSSGGVCLFHHVKFLPFKRISTKPSELIASLNMKISFAFAPGLFLSSTYEVKVANH
jgi:hypothetical protein